MKRDRFSQLPSSTELQDILATEAKRDIPPGKEGVHYFDFAQLERFGDHFGIDHQVITASFVRDDLDEQDIFAKGKEFVENSKRQLLGTELISEDTGILNDVYDYLAEEDVPEQSDLIFVFGAKTPLRIEKAAELYEQGMSKSLLVSGRGPFYGDTGVQTEAEIYARVANEKGVPNEAILIEDKSITIPDNVRCSLNLLDEKGIKYNSVILVNSPYTQRRGWAHFRKYVPDSIKLIRVNSGTADQYKRDAWFRTPAGIDVVLSEYFKAKVAVSLNTA